MTEEVVKFLGATGLFLAATAWLIRSLVTHRLSKDIEDFKTTLQHESKIEIQQVAILHARRAEIIAELYKLLVEFVGSAESYASLLEWNGEPDKNSKQNILADCATDFRKYFVVNRIYFSKDLCAEIDKLWSESMGPIKKYSFWRAREERSEKDSERAMEAWDKAAETMDQNVPSLLKKIEDEFRTLLGVEHAEI